MKFVPPAVAGALLATTVAPATAPPKVLKRAGGNCVANALALKSGIRVTAEILGR